jgi:hypothetical protein
VLVPIAQSIIVAAQLLPDMPSRYFVIDEKTLLLPLQSLILTRARPIGIENAVALMCLAYDGKQQRRAPISVRPRADGAYLVIDGNSTVTVARAAGWLSIPCTVVKSD